MDAKGIKMALKAVNSVVEQIAVVEPHLLRCLAPYVLSKMLVQAAENQDIDPVAQNSVR